MYDHKLHYRKKYIFCYWLEASVTSTEELLKCSLKDCFKYYSNQKILMPKKSEYVKLKYYERKISHLL